MRHFGTFKRTTAALVILLALAGCVSLPPVVAPTPTAPQATSGELPALAEGATPAPEATSAPATGSAPTAERSASAQLTGAVQESRAVPLPRVRFSEMTGPDALSALAGAPDVSTSTAITPTPPVNMAAATGSLGVIDFAAAIYDGSPVSVMDEFPEGVTTVYAFFDAENVDRDQTFTAEWALDGETQDDLTIEETWDRPGIGTQSVRLFYPEGIPPGGWTLSLSLDGEPQQEAIFIVEPTPEDAGGFGVITFAYAEEGGEPVDPVPADDTVLAPDTAQIFAFFPVSGFSRGDEWSYQWLLDEEPITDEASERVTRTRDDTFWVRLLTDDGSPIGPGVYELRLSVDGRLAGLGVFTILEQTDFAPNDDPLLPDEDEVTYGFTPLVFAPSVVGGYDPSESMDTFPPNTRRFFATFSGIGIEDGTPYRIEWSLDGEALPDLTTDSEWDSSYAGPDGQWWSSVQAEGGLDAGEWQVDLYLDDELVESAVVTVEALGRREKGFGAIEFAAEVDEDGAVVDPASASDPLLPADATIVYAAFNGIRMPKETTYSTEWILDGDTSSGAAEWTWEDRPNAGRWVSCTAACFGGEDGDPLPPGSYVLKLWLDDELAGIGMFVVPEE